MQLVAKRNRAERIADEGQRVGSGARARPSESHPIVRVVLRSKLALVGEAWMHWHFGGSGLCMSEAG